MKYALMVILTFLSSYSYPTDVCEKKVKNAYELGITLGATRSLVRDTLEEINYLLDVEERFSRNKNSELQANIEIRIEGLLTKISLSHSIANGLGGKDKKLESQMVKVLSRIKKIPGYKESFSMTSMRLAVKQIEREL